MDPDSKTPEQPKRPKCEDCRDTGLYDACCRPHACDCEAGKRFRERQALGAYAEYGDYGPGRYR